jgi:hypothetical protein
VSTFVILTLVLLSTQKAQAQDEPAPHVARISLVRGDVSTRRGDSKDWLATTANAPLMYGDSIATGPGSRTEIQLDYANNLRLDQATGAKVADLSAARIQIQVATGLVTLATSRSGDADIEIDTPNMAVHPVGVGVYRVQVNSVNSAQLSVWKGRVEVTTSRGSINLTNGQAIEVKGAAAPEYKMSQALVKDGWDHWNDQRDHNIVDALAWQHTSRYYTGSEDLDRYGDWVQVPGYDWCWAPYVEAKWVPYRNGRWVSDPYYQWMWVGYEPWGWAPYHYGRWVNYDGSWCWWPGVGANGPHPVWGPGYVAFIGFGGPHEGSGQAVGFDSIGWCPLGPRDHFTRWWGRGQTFASTSVASISNAGPGSGEPAEGPFGSNLQGMVTNPHLRAAVTTLSAQNFANARVGHDLYPVNEAMLQQGSLIEGALSIAPATNSLRAVARPVNPAVLPLAATHDQIFFTRNVPPAPPVSRSTDEITPMANQQPPGVSEPRDSRLTGRATREEVITGANQNSVTADQAARQATGQPGARAGWRRFAYQMPCPRPNVDDPAAEEKQKSAPPVPNSQPPVLTPAPQGKQGGWRHFGPQPSAPVNRDRRMPAAVGNVV